MTRGLTGASEDMLLEGPPRIAVAYARTAPSHSTSFARELRGLENRAVAALSAAGGTAVSVDSGQRGPLDVSGFDGVLLLGGGDVDPALYSGNTAETTLDGVHRPADEFEIRLIGDAVAHGLPVLAICRGLQIANVAFGGSLVEDLGPDSIHRIHIDAAPMAVHEVTVEPGSRLAEALGETIVDVACGHHQAIHRLGNGLRPVSWAPDGLIEAVEHDAAWLLGVQWHPEDVAAPQGQSAALLEAFLAACRAGGRR